MPKVTFEFNLPEEQNELNLALDAGKYISAIDEIKRLCRNISKHSVYRGAELSEDNCIFDFVQELQDILSEIDTL